MNSSAFSPASGTTLPLGLPVLAGTPSSTLDDARLYLTRAIPWVLGAYTNVHWTVPNPKFDPRKPEGHHNKPTFLRGRAFTSLDETMAFLKYALNRPGYVRDVYICQSAQTDAEPTMFGTRPGFKAIRLGKSAVALKALYADLDVKPDGYATPAAAGAAFGKFLRDTGLPMPTLGVKSGTGGAHIYWVLDKALHVSDWQVLADALAEAARRHGFKIDTNCTVDAARLLRLPETYNHKGATPLPVTLMPTVQPQDIGLDLMKAKLLPYMTARSSTPATKNSVNSALTAGIQAAKAPLIDLASVAAGCAFYRDALANHGAAWTQPMWNVGVYGAQFMTAAGGDGRWIAHQISSGHPGYVEADTDALYDRKVSEKEGHNSGWPSCAAVQSSGCTSCASCPLLALERSPLAHGRPIAPPNNSPEQQADAGPNGADDQDVLTEDGAAREFAARHAGELLHCHSTGRWHVWSGAAWVPNECDIAFQEARELARELCAQQNPRARYLAGKASFAGAVEKFARSDPAFAVTIEVWDTDPWQLGTPGGTVDLRTGVLREARREDRITKLAAVTPAETANCPTWLRFLHEVTQGDAGYTRFLKQLCGYCLTGDTSEQALFFAYGGGGNGKGVFIHTLDGIMGDYASVAAMEVFTAAQHDRHPTEIAALRGARLVTASETEQNRKFAESRIKQLTGGDTMRARYMRQDEFEFTPVLKLVLVGNNKPGLTNVDDAARRRFNLLPFLFRPAMVDPLLETKLQAEWPGILRWMIEGCVDWQKNGLNRPTVVKDATAEYFEVQDVFKQWLDEKCIVQHGNPNRKTAAQELFASWSAFAFTNNEPAGSVTGFGERMERLGFKKKKVSPTASPGVATPASDTRVRGYEGITLKPTAPGMAK